MLGFFLVSTLSLLGASQISLAEEQAPANLSSPSSSPDYVTNPTSVIEGVPRWITSTKCSRMLKDGKEEAIPAGLVRSLCPALRRYHSEIETADPDQKGSDYLAKYGQTCAVQKFIRQAESVRQKTPGYMCYRGVKNTMNASAKWMLAGGPELQGGSARMAKDDLKDRDFVDLLPSHPEYAQNPDLAPPGAMLVYVRNVGKKPPKTSISNWNTAGQGDIQIRTTKGYSNDFQTKNSMLAQPIGKNMHLAAVMIRPFEIGTFDPMKKCYEATIDGLKI